MIVSLIKSIGEAFLGDKSIYEVLVDNQKEYKSKYVGIVDWNSKTHDFKVSLEEYDDEKRYQYGRGTTSGTAVNLSPSINMNWNVLETPELLQEFLKNPNSKKEFDKLLNLRQNITNMIKKSPEVLIKHYPIFNSFLEWTEKNSDNIRIEIIKEIYELTKGLKKKEKPNTIIFKIDSKYPGEYNFVKESYAILAGMDEGQDTSDSEKDEGICAICEKKKKLTGGFNYGGFTLDQIIFQNKFFKDFEKNVSGQYSICYDCLNYCKEGFNILEQNLKFYAYSEKVGKNTVKIYHYLIPIIFDPNQLKIVINNIAQIRRQYNKNKETQLSQQIIILNERINRLTTQMKSAFKDKLKKISQEKEKYDTNTNIDIPESFLIERIKDFKIAFIDLYFKELDLKQNPITKETVKIFIINADHIEELAQAIKETIHYLNLSNYFSFRWMKDLVGMNSYLNYLEALYLGNYINSKQFLKDSNEKISQAWLYRLFNLKNLYYQSKMKNFDIFFTLFSNAHILK